MYLKTRVRHAIVAVVLASSIATAVGASGAAQADNGVPQDPPAAAVPSSPPATEIPAGSDAGDDAVPGTTSPPPPGDPSASSPTPPASTEPTVAPTPTDAPTTTAAAAITPSTTEPPAAIATTTTTPPTTGPAIATTTTVAPNNALANVVAFSAATAPLSPVATPGNAIVKLTWLKPSSNGGAAIDYYQLQRATSAAGPWTSLATPTTLNYTANGTNGTKYYFRIRAHNSAGYGPFSTVVNATPRTVPTAPLSPTATPGNGRVTLTWKAPSSNGGATVVKYAVQRLVNGQWQSIAYPTTGTYTALGLTNGTKYYFRIRAYNAAGWSPVSTTVSAVPRTVPTAPTYLTSTPGDGSIALSWKPPTSNGGAAIDMYMVMRATSLAGPWTTLPVQTPTNGIYTGLTNGTTYYFRVYAHNALWDANNGWSAASYVVADIPRTVPGAPAACSASNGNHTTYYVAFTWQPPSSNGGAAITSYRIELWKNGSLYSVTTAPPGSPHYALTEVGSTGLYYVRVRAQNAAGFGAPCYGFVYV